MIYTFLSYGNALNCIAASSLAAYIPDGLKTHWRFRSRGSMSLRVELQTAPNQNNWSRTKITCDYCPADQNPRGTISEILVRPDRNRPDQNSGDNYPGGQKFRYCCAGILVHQTIIPGVFGPTSDFLGPGRSVAGTSIRRTEMASVFGPVWYAVTVLTVQGV